MKPEFIKITHKLVDIIKQELKYVRHTSDCEYEMEIHDVCTCGLSNIILQYNEELKFQVKN